MISPEAPAMSTTEPEKVLSVSSLNQMAKSCLRGTFHRSPLKARSQFANPASGHWYFTLKDQKSQLRCASLPAATAWSDSTRKTGIS